MAYQKKDNGYYTRIENEGGAVLGVTTAAIIEKDGFAFKDLAGTGELLPYEDWRLSSEERARDLASRLDAKAIAGLTLFSSHQQVPAGEFGRFAGTYDGKKFSESDAKPYDLSDQQKRFIPEDGIRTVLVTDVAGIETLARWNNNLQSLAESSPFGIPVSTSSDPRHGTRNPTGRQSGEVVTTSKWPQGLGLAATFRPEVVKEHAEIVAKEYRAMGITSALSPQIDLGSDPRWMRTRDTFGAHVKMSQDMARAYCDGIQTTEGSKDGWGAGSVNAMAKHWPGGGTGEGGRDAHYAYGKYAVYPGNNFDMHMSVFTEGAFKLDGPTGMCGAIMPYYTISTGIDPDENVGNAYSHYIIHDLLREKYHYDGIVCTDWGVTQHETGEKVSAFAHASHGVETMERPARILKAIMNGVDQFGGDNEVEPVMAAYNLGVEKYGEEVMKKRFEETAYRILLPLFRTGLFENPYLVADESRAVIGKQEYVDLGFKRQLESIVLLKNKNNVLPLKPGTKVYVPDRLEKGKINFFGNLDEDKVIKPAIPEQIAPFLTLVDSPEEADVALVLMESPQTLGYNDDDRLGEKGYLPISLQYRSYTAVSAREQSIGQGDYREIENPNRSYKGKTAVCYNEKDLDNVIEMRKVMGDKPVIAVLTVANMTVPAEFEPYLDALLVDFYVDRKATYTILTGGAEPSALLPFIMPADMETVETHCEDLPFDMTPYTDSEGHTYDFGYGMNWSGVIHDERNEKYNRENAHC